MRAAFVIQLSSVKQCAPGQMEGWAEEVDTGSVVQFRSENELIAFMRERVAEIRNASKKERADDRYDE